MRTIIAGSRDIEDYAVVEEAVRASGFEIDTVLSGCARGVDTSAIRWAKEHGIPVEEYPADWDTFGKQAGPVRNTKMVESNAEALIAIMRADRPTSGTTDCTRKAQRAGLRVYVHYI